MIAVRDALGLKTVIVGATAKEAPAYASSFLAGKPVSANVGKTIADGVACRVPDPRAVEIIFRGAARMVNSTKMKFARPCDTISRTHIT